ncbi:hypothetical protein BST97_09380 [Nonlabens spongiae]|uniref:Uncharacterized protein n=1 Tax=Nonlabens spongiae TaxID=331648 RepID=A0A1W6ML12_9FLAO|nr:hypothetical protein BST97_09380 [Nonlabens spongiae]
MVTKNMVFIIGSYYLMSNCLSACLVPKVLLFITAENLKLNCFRYSFKQQENNRNFVEKRNYPSKNND